MSRLEVVRWLGDQGPILMRDLPQARERIDRYAAYTRDRAPLGAWAVELTDERVVAGTVLLAPLQAHDGAEPDPLTGTDEVEIAWFLHPDSWGRGYATEAARAVLTHAFAAGLPRVWALTHPGNDASQAVCRKLGMRHLGLRQRWYALPFEEYLVTAEEYAAS